MDNQIKNLLIKKNTYSFKPNLVFISGGAFCVFPKTIQEIKDAFNAPVVLISGVNPTHGSPKAEKEIVASGIVDLVIANDKGFAKNWEKLGAKEVVSLPISAANIHLWKKVMLSKKEQEIYHSDICFIGSLTADRQEILKTLTGYNLKIWGSIPTGTKLLHGLKPYYYGTAAGEKAVKIFNSAKIVLNLHVEEMKYGGNLRTFEIPASGAFQMVDRYDSAWFKEGKEIVIFHGNKDLRKKIEFYLRYEKERKKIALAGYKRVLKDHVYAKRFKTILAIVKTL
ncbi:MAG: glycosyltransferase [Candidatus Levyibacteriota bacterium]